MSARGPKPASPVMKAPAKPMAKPPAKPMAEMKPSELAAFEDFACDVDDMLVKAQEPPARDEEMLALMQEGCSARAAADRIISRRLATLQRAVPTQRVVPPAQRSVPAPAKAPAQAAKPATKPATRAKVMSPEEARREAVATGLLVLNEKTGQLEAHHKVPEEVLRRKEEERLPKVVQKRLRELRGEPEPVVEPKPRAKWGSKRAAKPEPKVAGPTPDVRMADGKLKPPPRALDPAKVTIELLSRPSGATLVELQRAIGMVNPLPTLFVTMWCKKANRIADLRRHGDRFTLVPS